MDAVRNYGLFALGAAAILATAALPEGWSMASFLAGALLVAAQIVLHDPRIGTLATSLVCAGSAAYLLARKFDASGPSMCAVNDVINCDAVNSSAASELFGIPISLLGLGLYLGLAVATLTPTAFNAALHRATALFAIVSLGYSAWLAYQSVVLGAVCLVCISMYVGHAILLVSALLGLKRASKPLFADLGAMVTSAPALAIVGVFVVTTLVGASAYQSKGGNNLGADIARVASKKDGPVTAADLAPLYGAPRGPVTLAGDEPILGDPNAPILLLEYADYGCGHCARASAELKTLVAQAPQVQVRFRPFPLSGACNPVIDSPEGGERCMAAMATRCAGEQGKFWQLSEAMFKNLGYLDPYSIEMMAKQVGVEIEPWKTCLERPETLAAVKADAQSGAAAGVRGTPTFFVKGLTADGFVEVPGTAQALTLLVDAVERGTVLPFPTSPLEL